MACLLRIAIRCLLFLMLTSGAALAKGETKVEDSEKPQAEACKKRKLTARGRPNRIQVMATMSAIVSWIKRSTKAYGKEYGDWHRAKNSKIKCSKVKGSDYHLCDVSGKPCVRPKLEELPNKEKLKKPQNT